MAELIQIKDYDELLARIYELALEHRATFNGLVRDCYPECQIFVMYTEQGKEVQLCFANKEYDGGFNIIRRLKADGFAGEDGLDHEAIIQHFEALEQDKRTAEQEINDREQAEAREAQKEREREAREQHRVNLETRRWKLSFLVTLAALILSALFSLLGLVKPDKTADDLKAVQARLDKLERVNGPTARP